MNVLGTGRHRRRSKTSSEHWHEASMNSGRYRQRSAPPDDPAAPLPRSVKSVCDDDRTPRIVDLMATTEALQTWRKKHYEEDRSDNSKDARVRVPRCPLKGAGRKVRQRRGFNTTASPILFTIPNFLTREDCERYIAGTSQSFRHQTKEEHLGWDGGEVFAKDEPPSLYLPEVWLVHKAQAAHFTRTNAYSRNVEVLWASKLRAVFESITLEGHEEMRAVGVTAYPIMHRYENGEKCEPHNSGMLQKPRQNPYCDRPDLLTTDGYDVLVYLNGGQAGADSSDGSPRVVGGETVFYSQHYLNGNSLKSHIAKVAPETGLAVCVAIGQHNPLIEIRAVTKGVMYMLEFRVLFGTSIAAKIRK